jgi:phosphoribosyl 1,2-cyclic phosphodiesterase
MKTKLGNVELTFLGTRGEIKGRSRYHWQHSALLVRYRAARIMIDCGTDWLGQLRAIAPTAIVLTHAHPDHAAGLAKGAPCPVYATKATWDVLRHFPVSDRRTIPLQKSKTIAGVRFKALPVRHSIRAPAVGYRVSAGTANFFYLPDVAKLPHPSRALRAIDIYIGDGATVIRSMVRKKRGTEIGHAPIISQLEWCATAGVRRAIFTHCGSAIVRAAPRMMATLVRRLARVHGINARIARDGNRLILPGRTD